MPNSPDRSSDSAPEVSVSTAARQKGVAPRTVRRWVSEGLLPAERIGPRLIRIKQADLDRLGRSLQPSKGSAA